MSVLVANQINAADMGIDGFIQVDTQHPRLVATVFKHKLAWHNAFFDNRLFVINIMDKLIERADTLLAAFFHHLPFLDVNDAWDNIKRYHALNVAGIAIHSEGHAAAIKNIRCLVIQTN